MLKINKNNANLPASLLVTTAFCLRCCCRYNTANFGWKM